MKKVIELIRVSTAKQADDDRFSIPAQRTVCRKIAAQYGLTIVDSMHITDVGGSDILKAPEMKELLRRIQSPDIHGVVAREFSRLMRPENLDDFTILQRFAESRTFLYLPDGPISRRKRGDSWAGSARFSLDWRSRSFWSGHGELARRCDARESSRPLRSLFPMESGTKSRPLRAGLLAGFISPRRRKFADASSSSAKV